MEKIEWKFGRASLMIQTIFDRERSTAYFFHCVSQWDRETTRNYWISDRKEWRGREYKTALRMTNSRMFKPSALAVSASVSRNSTFFNIIESPASTSFSRLVLRIDQTQNRFYEPALSEDRLTPEGSHNSALIWCSCRLVNQGRCYVISYYIFLLEEYRFSV